MGWTQNLGEYLKAVVAVQLSPVNFWLFLHANFLWFISQVPPPLDVEIVIPNHFQISTFCRGHIRNTLVHSASLHIFHVSVSKPF